MYDRYKLLVFLLLSILIFEYSNAAIKDSVIVNPFIEDSTLIAKRLKIIANQQSTSLYINEFMAYNNSTISDEYGEFDDWIELYNYGDEPVNLRNFYITDDFNEPTKHKFTTNKLVIQPNEFILLWADNQPEQGIKHLSFKLSGDFENIALYTPDISLIDSVIYSLSYKEYSYGRSNNQINNWNYFIVPTPGEDNTTEGLLGMVDAPMIWPPGGFYSNSIKVGIKETYSTQKIYYTIDGSEPTESSLIYSDSIEIRQTSILRFRSFYDGYVPSKIVTHTYFINDPSSIRVLSVSSDHNGLYGQDGIFKSLKLDKEVPAHYELFEDNQDLGFAIDAGIKGHSDVYGDQIPFKMCFRKEYGVKELNYPLFANNPVTTFNKLIVRCGGNDKLGKKSGYTHIRDVLIHDLAKRINPDIDISSYSPVKVYINAKYKGIYFMRERQDKDYITTHYSSEDFDLLERAFEYDGNRDTLFGSWDAYLSLEKFIDTSDASIESIYSYICSQIDIDNFIDYWIHQVYIGNYDWLSNNIKYWKPKDTPGKWKWIFWDTDHGLGLPFGIYGKPAWNSLEFSIGTKGDRTWNGANNIIIRNLLENEEFKNKFIARFCDLLNSYYQPDYIISVVDSVSDIIRPEMPRHLSIYNTNVQLWESNLMSLKDYIEARPDSVWGHIKSVFNRTETKSIKLRVVPANSGVIKINSIKIDAGESGWEGNYFKNQSIQLKAVPNLNFKLGRWSNGLDKNTIEFNLESDTVITVYFTTNSADSIPIYINEISFVNNMENSGQWIELYNFSVNDADLSSYSIMNKSGNNPYIFPAGTVIKPLGYMVICNNIKKFSTIYPTIDNVIGDFNFIIDKTDDFLYLKDSDDKIIKSVEINSDKDWIVVPDGYSNSTELIDINNYSSPYSWQFSYNITGTPGRGNSAPSIDYYSGLVINEIKAYNNNTIIDEHGDYDDWIELYNNSDEIIEISKLYFTDSLINPFKSYITDSNKMSTIILPKGYKLLWADNEPNEGATHLNFKLNREGETVAIYYNDHNNPVLIDKVTYDYQYSGYSYGRIYDGDPLFDYILESPNSSNYNHVNISNNSIEDTEFNIYPNPTKDYINISVFKSMNSGFEIQLFDFLGKQIIQEFHTVNSANSCISLNISHLKNGVYCLRIVKSNKKDKPYISKIIKY